MSMYASQHICNIYLTYKHILYDKYENFSIHVNRLSNKVAIYLLATTDMNSRMRSRHTHTQNKS